MSTRSRASGARRRGALAVLLHTHMPYVEGFGTWPFGEEWLWEAMATCYVPLVRLLRSGAPLTLSLTPVLCDQLEVAGLAGRFERFLREVRSFTHGEDARGLRESGEETLARELERAAGDYERALEGLGAAGGDLLGALAPYAAWTSSATHAALPLLASRAGLRLQVQTGVRAHALRFGDRWRGGFWMPECAHEPRLEAILAEAGVRSTCIELGGGLEPGAREHLQPYLSPSGVVLVPIDRATISLAWSDQGYPAHAAYRDYHRRTVHSHHPWCNGGGAYDHDFALRLAREHAAEFVARTRERLRCQGAGLPGGGLAVFAADTELFGHWWYEGMDWLGAVVDECARQGLELVHLDEALARAEPADPPPGWAGLEASSWGAGRDLSTWSVAGPEVAEMAAEARRAELAVLAGVSRVGQAAARELLALQASDWAFMVARGLAVPYARERFAGHREALARAIAEGPQAPADGLRNLAVHARAGVLQEP